MPWNVIHAEIVPDNRPLRPMIGPGGWNLLLHIVRDDLLRPMIGPGGMTREQAHAEVQDELDRVPALGKIAALWRRGAKGDTVYAGLSIWAIHEHPDGEDPHRAALVWLEDLAQKMRGSGMDVQVAPMPETETG